MCYAFFKRYDDGWAEKFEELQIGHEEQIKKIDAAREEERIRHKKNIEQLKSELEIVQKKYEDQKKALEIKKKTIVKKIVEESGNDPNALAQQLSEVTGFRIQKKDK